MKLNLLQAVKNVQTAQREQVYVKAQRALTNTGGNYVALADMVNAVVNDPSIRKSLDKHRERLAGQKYTKEHFGRVGYVPLGKIFINVDIQREIEKLHISNQILPIFDPRITQPVNLVYYKDGDYYTEWDGLQTSSTILLLILYAMVETDDWSTFEIKANIIDSDLVVPAPIVDGAEAIANFAFRTINGDGKKGVEPFFVFRSQCNGALLYGSTLREDVHSMQMWQALLNEGLYPADSTTRKLPSHMSHISGMCQMAGHNTEAFDVVTFGKSGNFIKQTAGDDTGVNSSYYMVIADLFNMLRDQNITVGTKASQFNLERFRAFIFEKYGTFNTSHAFREISKRELEAVRKKQGFKTADWTDDCGVPFLLAGYREYCEENGFNPGRLPEPLKYTEFVL
jgi:hypothetical protein